MMNPNLRYAINLAVMIVAALAIAGMVNYLSARHYARFDWTADNYYSLSEKSINVLSELQQPVKIIVFLNRSRPAYEDVQQLLNQYLAHSSLIEVEYVDVDRNPVRAKELSDRYNIVTANYLIFECGEQTKYVTDDTLVEYDYSTAAYGGTPEVTGFYGESVITASILEVTQSVKPSICLTSGHGEPPLPALHQVLTQENLEIADLNLLTAPGVPDTCSVLLILGPRSDFLDIELAKVAAYLDRGGRAIFALDPMFKEGGGMQHTGLEELTARYGITVNDDLVFDPGGEVTGYVNFFFYSSTYGQHAITKPLANIPVLFLTARSLAPAGGDNGLTYTPLVRSSAAAWGETDMNTLTSPSQSDADISGPVDIACIIESDSSAMQLAVFGDVDFIAGEPPISTPPYIHGPNFQLLTYTINYMAERESLISIPPRSPKASDRVLTHDQVTMLLWLTLGVIPLICLAAGITVWLRRRS